jgi:serine/threonine-protein kinase RsbW
MAESLTIEVPNTRDAIAPASAQAEHWLRSHSPSVQTLNLLLTAIEELVLNSIEYGYDDSDPHTISLVLSIDRETLTITVIDGGRPFDPLAAPPPDLSLPVLARPVGGLGLYLLRQLSDQVSYERRDGANRLTLTKRLRP